jgi:uncharacterized protein YndB with AHSA1/START domain
MITTMEQTPQATKGRWRHLFYRGPASDKLYDDYASQRRIDHAAPITASREVTIDAPAARVWELLAQPQHWGDIDTDITDVQIPDAVVEGAHFTWRNGRTRMASRFAVVDRNHELTWTGAALGAKVVHRHVLTDLGDNTSRLWCEESMAGPFLVLLYSSAKLDAALEKWLTAIRSAATR